MPRPIKHNQPPLSEAAASEYDRAKFAFLNGYSAGDQYRLACAHLGMEPVPEHVGRLAAYLGHEMALGYGLAWATGFLTAYNLEPLPAGDLRNFPTVDADPAWKHIIF